MIRLPVVLGGIVLGAICLALASCVGDRPSVDPNMEENREADDMIGASTMEKWSRSCALCHINGEGGAPRVGQADEWAPRAAQGEELMLERIIEGYNNMPPLGYCMDCSRQDFLKLTRFMAGES